MTVQAVGTAPAAAFRDSAGVGTHPTYLNTVHNREAELAHVIAALGVRHVRNELAWSDNAGWNKAVWDRMAAWGKVGIRSSWRIDRGATTWSPEKSLTKWLTKVSELDALAPVSIEGTNEANLFSAGGFPASERAHTKALFEAVRAHPDPRISQLPVIGPSFISNGAAVIGDISAWITHGNTHPYAGGGSPTPAYVKAHAVDYYWPAGKGKPNIVTECGYHTALKAGKDAQPGVDERTQAIYTLRTLGEHFLAGIARTYLYEAVDVRVSPADAESCFGLLRNDLAPKPAAVALQRLLLAVGDGTPSTLVRLQLGFEQKPGDTRALALQRGDGSHAVILWRSASVWDRDKKVKLEVPREAIRLALPGAGKVTITRPLGTDTQKKVAIHAGQVELGLGAEVVVLEIRP